MIYATKIKMCSGHSDSMNCQNIKSIYLVGAKEEAFYTREAVYNYLVDHPTRKIEVKLGTNPNLEPKISSKGTKYVQSAPNNTEQDNLLKLPRE